MASADDVDCFRVSSAGVRADPLEWPKRFAARHGRAPRILHIANVANYAFSNATLMSRYGVEAEVVDPDSYHIMASPEWYEVDVRGDWGDDSNPRWHRTDLAGYRRPDWFTQGYCDLAFARVAARRRGDDAEDQRLRHALEQANRLRSGLLALGVVRTLLRTNDSVARIARAAARRLVYGLRAPARPPTGAGQDRGDGAPQTVRDLSSVTPLLREALLPFDIVQGYALGALFPLVIDHPSTIAYELGTLRGLPFEPTEAGRTCAWVYRSARRVFVTNVDCIAAARKLGVAADRIVPTLHAFDTDVAVSYKLSCDEHAEVPTDRPYFFAPARHHWVEGSASFMKGNDTIVRAAASLAAEGREFRVVFVDWGDHVAATRDLIAKHGLEAKTVWIRPRSRPGLWPVYARAVAVIDQFFAPALGGIALESLALGRRLLTLYDEQAGASFFRSPPPLKNCRTSDELAAAMRDCLSDLDDGRGLGRRSREWMLREHSTERQMRDQFGVYETITL